MSFKRLLILVYSAAGFFIALFTAFMTYLIIGEPIGMKMFSKIALVVILAMPIVALVSYTLGKYLYAKFSHIHERLDQIASGQFHSEEPDESIEDLQHMHHAITLVSERLSEQIETLRSHNRRISDMAVSFAHDVKTPLTILDGYLEEIRDGMISPDMLTKTIDKLKQESGYINDLSSDILEYLHSMRTTRDCESIVLNELVAEIIPLIAFSPDTHYTLDIPSDSVIVFNRMDLKKLLINLLHNSAKFTSNGEIHLFTEGESIIVQDTGCGIDPVFFPRLFEPYSTAESSRNRKKSGLGLGLSIAKNLALNNGYDIVFDEDVEVGTRAFIRPLRS